MTEIIPATTAHVPQMVELWSNEISDGDAQEEVRSCVEHYPSFVSLNENGNLNGLTYTLAIGKDTLLLHGLLVAAADRNNNVGSELLVATEQAAKSLGYTAILLTNSMQYHGADKRSAVPFYERHGYKVSHVTINQPPTYLLVKDLC